jgi:ArsR family transcriptional regulator, cadmium/lead-responsive transcriptional repressor
MSPSAVSTLKAKLFRGLGDLSRLAIVEALREGERTVSDLVLATGLSQPNTSAHLACLRDCGIVVSRQQGRFVFYALACDELRAILDAAETLVDRLGDPIAGCIRYERDDA